MNDRNISFFLIQKKFDFIFLFTFSDYFCSKSQGVLFNRMNRVVEMAEIIPKEPGRVMSLRE